MRFAAQEDLNRIAEFNGTDAPFPADMTLHGLIEAQVRRHPLATAVLCDHDRAFGETSLTYGRLNEKVNQLARRLRAEGVGPGQIVALMAERSFAMVIGILGILKAGGAYLPLACDNPPERTRYILEDGGVRILLVQTGTDDRVQFRGTVIQLESAELYQGPADDPEAVSRPNDLAYVMYTSGSTGRPKGVMIEHCSVVNRLLWMQHAYPIGQNDVILQKTPYSFDVSVWELFWWALQGAALSLLMPGGERSPPALVETIRRHRVSTLHFVPSMLNVFLEFLEGKEGRVADLISVRRVFASGEALVPRHVRQFNRIIGRVTGARLINLYGPTETTVDVSHYACPTDDDFEKVPIGRPIHNTRFYILRNSRQVAIGETGELFVGGVGLARGYLRNPALTSERFIDNPVRPGERIYRTGDLARWLPDGNVEYLGREDHQVKIRGMRIELGEIENTIREHPDVRDCVVVARRFSESITLIIAYVVSRSAWTAEDLKRHARRFLPDYMVPNHFEPLEEIPLTPSGKADRKALPEPTILGSRV